MNMFIKCEEKLKTIVQPTPSYMIDDPIERAKAWIKEQEKVKVLETQSEYLKKILESTTTVTMTQIAKDYGMTAQEMNSLLHRLKVQYKQNDQWLLYSKYHKEGYVDSETIPIKHKSGIIEPKMYTKWTQKGRKFLYELLKVNENTKKADKEIKEVEQITKKQNKRICILILIMLFLVSVIGYLITKYLKS